MRILLSLLILGLALGACGRKPEAPEKPGEPQAVGREETRALRATEAVGYAGKAIADQTDAAIQASEDRKASLDAAIDAQSKPEN